ncbi:DUF4272 domain-containing protein [Pseudochryseolinea flava]|uniref:DUF4272 domain-containing protein n=1 Tax=Pseudochryseolinea flava TaxID=2059302 RepID=A0A364XU83_9BACT|nr:DUF4272 domain-containing protein [Pseudochryseolinea flava]RAV97722.1 DUF4272 domain-containing protein [Pseudochryseolinea flava]
MTAVERKENSEQRLAQLGIHIVDQLPPMEEEEAITMQSPQAIAERILILTYLNCIVVDENLKAEVVGFLHQENLWEKASDEEKKFFEQDSLTEDDAVKIGWRAESIWLLLWVINKVEYLDLPASEVNLNDIFICLPPFMTSTREFIESATIRSTAEVLDQSDFIFRLTWVIQKEQSGGSNEMTFSPGVSYERHFAITWATGVRQTWD